ncbi:Apurinic endonuclease (APN1) [Acidipropionibacterium acidipropionici ATCC 4875]|uniref:Apurinic endonuclease (APN1) n=1 Tax=Acidipropionibacterium acidipropionici (strain ATCC 4875 / DSM 20272 / JCM 6432 / NBRC 12425 / NCIMB 8070 / 4) TaxID=1171373 RepID=K7S8W3_ACIA4|nr:deoxyribonuclease IV [Acidipropionibacterium acidipropionici]AFV91002.1 Apurinic endonuclease (APN1) [Acidipropionibacterium acidipropionici ATCC 4875]
MTERIIGATVDESDLGAQAGERGANVAQIMVGDPQSWRKPALAHPGGAAGLREAAEEAGLALVVHAAYVINVASLNNRIRIPSRKLLQQTLALAGEIGAIGVVVHGGHVRDGEPIEQGQDNWRKAIDGLELPVPVFLENTAGGKHAMARELERIRGTWEAISAAEGAESVGFCLDTCHAFAAGLDMTSVVDDVRAITGRIDLVHVNDSQGPAGSGRDRHANLGKGQIDPDELAAVASDAGAPLVVETPGEAPDQAADIAWLRERLGA